MRGNRPVTLGVSAACMCGSDMVECVSILAFPGKVSGLAPTSRWASAVSGLGCSRPVASIRGGLRGYEADTLTTGRRVRNRYAAWAAATPPGSFGRCDDEPAPDPREAALSGVDAAALSTSRAASGFASWGSKVISD